MLRIRRAVRLGKPLNRSSISPAQRWAKPLSKQTLRQALHLMGPALAALLFAGVGSGVAHAQGTMDFSGAQTLMTTFKTFAVYAGAVICFGGLIFAGIRMMSGRFQDAIPGLFGALFGAGVLGWGAGWIGTWQGTIQSTPSMRIVLTIENGRSGEERALLYRIDMPGHEHDAHPMSSFAVHGNEVKFTADMGAGSYSGELSEGSSSIVGTWVDEKPSPLTFVRVQKNAAWHTDTGKHKAQFIEVEEGIQLEVLDWGGTGRPLILIPGLADTAHVFDDFAPALAKSYHVYGITARGAGVRCSTMRYAAEETAQKHARVLREASRLFRARGFDGASISEIMTATGLTHGSFYNHFESKEDLLAKSYAKTSAESLAMLDRFEPSPKGKRTMFCSYLNAAHRDDVAGGCIMAALATDFSDHPKARAVMTQHIRKVIDGLAGRFPWPSRRARRKQATKALILMVGGP